jgi:hypothetical protein
MRTGIGSESSAQPQFSVRRGAASTIIPPRIGTVEVTEDTPILVLPLAERRRLFRRRRQMVHLREWIAVAGISFCGLIVASIALVSVLAH